MKNNENNLRAYIGEITIELSRLARTEGMDLVAHLLEMVALETESGSKKTHDVQCR